MKNWIIITSLTILSLFGFIIYDYSRFYDGKLHLVFCDVGQGDAIFMRTPGNKNFLIDAGPDESVLSCLSRYMPFWDRTIHKMILTHPHEDHYFGMHYVIDRYSTLGFDTEDLINTTAGYSDLIKVLVKHKVQTRNLYAGDIYTFTDGVAVKILGPSRTYLQATSSEGKINEANEFASLILQVNYGNFDLLLTGDSQVGGLLNAFKLSLQRIEILQVPHHGSKTGLSSELLDYLKPLLAVISVGKNKYGHPHKEILHKLSDKGIKILRTDEAGDIEIVSDGRTWFVKP